ncbi:hypothetical protein D3C85_1533550 [compost metagenome]
MLVRFWKALNAPESTNSFPPAFRCFGRVRKIWRVVSSVATTPTGKPRSVAARRSADEDMPEWNAYFHGVSETDIAQYLREFRLHPLALAKYASPVFRFP